MEEELLKKIDEISDEMISGIKRIVQIDSVQSEAMHLSDTAEIYFFSGTEIWSKIFHRCVDARVGLFAH